MQGDGSVTIFDLSAPGRGNAGYIEPFEYPGGGDPVLDETALPARLRRGRPPLLPEVAEIDVVRHYTALSQRTFSVDRHFYPLGSCTMKYNPKVNEVVAASDGLRLLHPYQPEDTVQGALQLIWELERMLAELAGMHATTLTPSAGAQGELMGLLIVRAYHASRGDERSVVLIPDSAHGTNPASVTLAGCRSRPVASSPDGRIDLSALKDALNEDVAAIMVTNPNTHGLFERDILRITEMVHDVGAQIYCDGANMNALLGVCRFGDLGFDVCHLNLHKTFSTPHGGGGPGAGALCVKEHLAPFLPAPVVERRNGVFTLGHDLPQSVGRMRAFYGNFANLARAYSYVRALGRDGMARVGRTSVINANYLLSKVPEGLDAPFGDNCMHEFIVSAKRIKKETGVRALDIAKRLLDYGFHPPTMYFPLTVEEDLLIEPTESESLRTLDAFAEALAAIVKEAYEDPEVVKSAPHTTFVRRLDEAEAARHPVLRWRPGE